MVVYTTVFPHFIIYMYTVGILDMHTISALNYARFQHVIYAFIVRYSNIKTSYVLKRNQWKKLISIIRTCNTITSTYNSGTYMSIIK